MKEIKRGINLQVNMTKQEILKVINASGLPVTLTRYIFEEILNEIRQAEMNIIDKEREEYEKEKKEQENRNKLKQKEGGKKDA